MSNELSGKRIAFLVAPEGAEQAELTRPWEAVERAGLALCSVRERTEVSRPVSNVHAIEQSVPAQLGGTCAKQLLGRG